MLEIILKNIHLGHHGVISSADDRLLSASIQQLSSMQPIILLDSLNLLDRSAVAQCVEVDDVLAFDAVPDGVVCVVTAYSLLADTQQQTLDKLLQKTQTVFLFVERSIYMKQRHFRSKLSRWKTKTTFPHLVAYSIDLDQQKVRETRSAALTG